MSAKRSRHVCEYLLTLIGGWILAEKAVRALPYRTRESSPGITGKRWLSCPRMADDCPCQRRWWMGVLVHQPTPFFLLLPPFFFLFEALGGYRRLVFLQFAIWHRYECLGLFQDTGKGGGAEDGRLTLSLMFSRLQWSFRPPCWNSSDVVRFIHRVSGESVC
jgi:hypothetical protein